MTENINEKRYRQIDIEAMQRIIEPLESELESALTQRQPNIDQNQKEELLLDAMESMIFDTLDAYPAFSEIVDDLERRLNKQGVSFVSR